jgi:hypothetical protein
VGEQKPTGVRKLLGVKPSPGVKMFVCCPECAKMVRANPSTYLLEIIADNAVFTFDYDSAPNQRPERPKGNFHDSEPTATTPAPATKTTSVPAVPGKSIPPSKR